MFHCFNGRFKSKRCWIQLWLLNWQQIRTLTRDTQTDECPGKCYEILENVGWVINSFDFTKYGVSGSTFEVQQLIMEMAIWAERGVFITQKMRQAVKSISAGSLRLDSWDTKTNDSHVESYQIDLCAHSVGNVVMTWSACHFTATTVDYSFL